MNNAFICILFFMFSPLGKQENLPAIADQYIFAYKDIAVSEMERTGIPASIKLAQGLLESDWGRSDLAKEANNHFGIKCGSHWKGESFYKEDDDYVNGKLISSCFRKYNDAYLSFVDHSDFLSKPRYQFLYKYDRTDYKSWAKGLKKAGYATDRKYPSKLIQIIEKYELYKFDQYDSSEDLAENSHETKGQNEDVEDDDVFRSEHIEAVEITASSNHDLSPKSYEGQLFHTVGEKENMQDIANMHNIELKRLYAMNRIPFGAEPLAGEMLKLTGKMRLDTKVKYIRFPSQADPDSVFLF